MYVLCSHSIIRRVLYVVACWNEVCLKTTSPYKYSLDTSSEKILQHDYLQWIWIELSMLSVLCIVKDFLKILFKDDVYWKVSAVHFALCELTLIFYYFQSVSGRSEHSCWHQIWSVSDREIVTDRVWYSYSECPAWWQYLLTVHRSTGA